VCRKLQDWCVFATANATYDTILGVVLPQRMHPRECWHGCLRVVSLLSDFQTIFVLFGFVVYALAQHALAMAFIMVY
jgi:hypothetical protein